MCLLLLFCGTLAASPQWHQWFHGDGEAGDSTGSCAVELLASGGIDVAAGSEPELIGIERALWVLPAPAPQSVNGFVSRSAQNRGPPVF